MQIINYRSFTIKIQRNDLGVYFWEIKRLDGDILAYGEDEDIDHAILEAKAEIDNFYYN